MGWIAYCTTCGVIARGSDVPGLATDVQGMEIVAARHRSVHGHVTLAGYEPPQGIEGTDPDRAFGPMSLGEYYPEIVNVDTTEIIQYYTAYTTVDLAVQHAKDQLRTKYPHFAEWALVIKVYTDPPGKRALKSYGTYSPVHIEDYRMVREELTSGQAGADVEELRGRQARDRAEEVLGRISQPLGGWTMRDRPFPTTYNDWVNLGMDIKEKAGINDYETTAQVNRQLAFIADEDDAPSAAALSKRWLTNKAAELGIR